MKPPPFVLSLAASLSSAFQIPLVDNGHRSSQSSSISTTADLKLPGDSPLSLCGVSRPSDLFNITSLQLSKQPLYIHDDFLIHTYGTFSESISPNATLSLTVGYPDNNETDTEDFCEFTGIEQPLHGKKATCPPVKGPALLSNAGVFLRMFFGNPGLYNFTIDVKTSEGDRVFCVTAEVCLDYNNPGPGEHYPSPNCTWPA